jgi:Replication-relaxation
MLLTARDLALLEDVWRFRFLTTSQIEASRRCDPKEENRFVSRLTLTRRLKLLFHHRYLRRIARPLAQGSREPVYLLDNEGARVLSRTYGEVTSIPPSRLPGTVALDHLLDIVQMRLSLMAAGTESDGYALLEWLPGERARFRVALEEPGRKKQSVTVIPDGAAIVRLGGHRHYAFVEMDRGTEPQRTIAAKGRAYLAYWESGGFAEDFNVPVGLGFRVLFVAPTLKRAQTILRAVGSLDGPRQLFRVAQSEDITPQRVLRAVWLDGESGERVQPFAK